ncbi:MAG: hypothetical protein LBP25_01320 [Tannerellaceae bacterium]|nr:hypothetical protein [Tannerellaceae bacterium]
MQQKTIYVLLAFALLLAGGCKDDSEEMLKYQQPFLGQWQEIARGNDYYPELTPDDGHIIEFLPDGTYQAVWGNGGVSTRHYRVDAECVYYDNGTRPYGHIDRYSFTGTDTLRLDYVDGAITMSMATPTFNIYKRLKTNE